MKISYKGIDISYLKNGVGDVLVLLHGFLHSKNMWNEYVLNWEKNYTVIAIDLPGHGKSGIVKDISILEMAEIVNLVLEKEQAQICTIIGHSMGGYTGLAFAELFPEKLKKLVLFHSSAYADNDEVKKKRNLWLKIIDRHPAMFVRSVTEFLYTKENLIKYKSIVEYDITEAKNVGYNGYIEAIKAMRDRPDRIHVFNSNISIDILAGEHDKVIEKEVSQKQINLLKNGRGVFLENASHMGFIEEEDTCLKVLNELIGSI